ncbi:MAG: ABC transporter permease, partial [Actinobacteria bacterium]|nr:ABC transporter permease [Actinomycetota bacterium]
LSSDNIARNPKRTATTMNALIIGVLLVTLVSIAGNSLKSTVVDYIADQSTTDLYIASVPGNFSDDMLADIEAVDGVTASVAVRQIPVLVDGSMNSISTTEDLSTLSLVNVEPMKGSWDDLGDAAVALDTGGAMSKLGTRTVVNSVGTTYEMNYSGHLKNTFDAGSLGFVVSSAEFDKIAPPGTGVNFLLMTFEPTKKAAATRAIEDLTRGYGNILMIEGNFIGRIIESVFNFLINAVNGLLGMSVVIALIGIVNTLTLSVFERRRELGLLRAVGMTRREVRRMVRFEAVQMSLLGTLIGLGSGALLAWLLLRATDLQDVTFSWKNLTVIFLLGLVLGVVASIAPTRRVSKLDILASIKTE